MTLIKSQRNNLNPAHSLLNDFFGANFLDWEEGAVDRRYSALPPVNIGENDNDWSIELAVPGFKKEDFDIELDQDKLTISATIESEKTENENGFSKREFMARSFKRSFHLPEDKVNAEAIAAKYENGVLSLQLPKKEEAKPQPLKKIEIS